MTDSPAKYCAIPSSEDRAYDCNSNDTGVGRDEHQHAPAECLTKWTCFLLGCTTFLPWHVLVNAMPFFLSRLAGSPVYPTFSSYFTGVYTLARLVFQFYSTFSSKRSSPSRRIFMSIVALLVLTTSLCLSTFSRGTPLTVFAFALFNAASMAVAASYLSTAVYAVTALLGASSLQPVLTGQAASGVAVSAVQVASAIIALWGSSPKVVLTDGTIPNGRAGLAEEIAARITFGVSAIFLGIALVAYTWLARQPFYKSITGVLEQHRRVGDPDERTGLVADRRRNPPTVPNSHVYQVFRKNWIFMFSLAYAWLVSLSVYPAITTRVRPVDLGTHPLLFTTVHFLVMAIGGLLGRYSSSFPVLCVWSAKKILAMSLLRTFFIPLILLCNVDRPGTTPSPPIIHSDIVFMIIILTIGYTGGYVASLALLAVSSLEHNPRLKGRREDVDVAATLGGSFLILGSSLGAICSFGVEAMI
ncbi:nucleoside transporter-domain-containing protein [Boletus coccyginus]|nr:nucleoside transporter-domain-containing protein [Boletus coccyginus]